MKVLLIGGGGREHALAWKLRQSPKLSALYSTPGNAGIFEIADRCAADPVDQMAITRFCKTEAIDLVVVGPEAPLVEGLADRLRAENVPVFGPSRAAAQLEASKAFTKAICVEQGIPTASFGHFDKKEAALAFAHGKGAPLVVKADGLAAGKGVIICERLAEAEEAIEAIFGGAFGSAGSSVVIEEKLEGEEASFFAISDGKHAVMLTSAQDYKRAYEGDRGPNTGGMGAVSPAPMMTDALSRQIMQTIITPTLQAMTARGTPFQGVLYAGLMMTAKGPMLIEYNVRFGDPECQALMLRMKSDLLPLLYAAATGALPEASVEWSGESSIVVVAASKGYPGQYAKGSVIGGLERASEVPGAVVFHAGTERRSDGVILANGGRVLNACASGRDAAEAREKVYEALSKIDWPDGFYRHDIGWRSLNREQHI